MTIEASSQGIIRDGVDQVLTEDPSDTTQLPLDPSHPMNTTTNGGEHGLFRKYLKMLASASSPWKWTWIWIMHWIV